MTNAQVLKVGDFCKTGSGGTPLRSNYDRYYENGTIPWVKSGELRESIILSAEEYVTEAALKESSIKLVPAGALLLAMYGATVGRLAILGIEATTNQAVCHLIPNPKIADLRYLFHAISHQVPQIISMGVGGAQPNINQAIIKDLKVLLPPLLEQRRIAEILDQADMLRVKRREALAELDRLTQSIFVEMFGDLKGSSSNYKKVSLNSITRISTGSTPSRMVGGYYEGHIPWVKTTEVEGEHIFETEEMLTVAGFKAIRGKLHPIDSIVVAMYGQGQTRGRCALLKIEASCNQACGVIYPSDLFNSKFLFSQLRLSYDQLRALGRGGNQENLNLQILGAFEVILPPRDLQESFVQRLDKIEALKAQNQIALDNLNSLFTSLQHRAFRGEL